MAEPGWHLLLSCEHGGNRVPAAWRHLFAGHEEELETHRGYDLGIADFAHRLAAELHAPLHLAEVTRLLVELNRSPGHPALFSAFSRTLAPTERERLLAAHYHPYRNAVRAEIERLLDCGANVCHLSLHSFTPALHGVERNADIGLLYDPRRKKEAAFCRNWYGLLRAADSGFRVRRNYPYRGAADSFVTSLRRDFPATRYLGLELELNQRWPLQAGTEWDTLQQLASRTLAQALRFTA